MSGSEVGLCYPEKMKRTVDAQSGAPKHRVGAPALFPEHILETWPVEGEGRAGCDTNHPGHRGHKEVMHLHKKWYKQERVEALSRVLSQSNSGSSGELGVGDTPKHNDARTTMVSREGNELVSKKEQGIKALQKLGFCRSRCVKGWDVGKGDMGSTLRHMLQGRIQETVPVVKMGIEHKSGVSIDQDQAGSSTPCFNKETWGKGSESNIHNARL